MAENDTPWGKGLRCQVLISRESQNTEQGIMNVEGNANFSIRNS